MKLAFNLSRTLIIIDGNVFVAAMLKKMNANRQSPSRACSVSASESLASPAMSLDNWIGQKLARYLVDIEQDRLRRIASKVAGYRLMHLGVTSHHTELQGFKQLHQFYIRPYSERLSEQHEFFSSSVEADYDRLPLPNAVVDVVVLQHALEYCTTPQGVLAEAARVLAPGGHLILCVTNPLGPIGLTKIPMKLLTKRPEYHFLGLRKGRIKDWLSLLNFHIIQVYDGAYSLPFERLSSFKKDSFWERSCEKINLPFGNFYMIHAVKREAGGITNNSRRWKTAPSRGYVSPSKKIKHKE